MTNLTVKQEKFCQHLAVHGNASEAYRHAYNAGNMSDETVWKRASELKASGVVAGRLDELLAEALKRTKITQDTIAAMLMEDRKLAQDTEKASAAVSATMGLAKLYGLLTDICRTESEEGEGWWIIAIMYGRIWTQCLAMNSTRM